MTWWYQFVSNFSTVLYSVEMSVPFCFQFFYRIVEKCINLTVKMLEAFCYRHRKSSRRTYGDVEPSIISGTGAQVGYNLLPKRLPQGDFHDWFLQNYLVHWCDENSCIISHRSYFLPKSFLQESCTLLGRVVKLMLNLSFPQTVQRCFSELTSRKYLNRG